MYLLFIILDIQWWFQLESFVYTHMDFWDLFPTNGCNIVYCRHSNLNWGPDSALLQVSVNLICSDSETHTTGLEDRVVLTL